MFKGSLVALVTPMKKKGSIDYKSLASLVEFHIQAKTNGLVVVASTGESASLTDQEKIKIVKYILNICRGKIPVIAGTNENGAYKTLKLSQAMKELNVDACLISTPAYIKPTQHGLYEHYKFIAEQLSIPIILYNVPSRTCCDLLPETISSLSKISNIVGIKEASGRLERVGLIKDQSSSDFKIYSGDDYMTFDMMKKGACGAISVVANVAPAHVKNMCELLLDKQYEEAGQINNKLQNINQALFIETNPIPVKWVLSKMKLIKNYLRLPLTPLSENCKLQVKKTCQQADIKI